jgi:hypothetical protein
MTQEDQRLPVTVAYVILAHGNPEQVARLVGTLPSNSPVLIHFDRRAPETVYRQVVELLRGRPKLHFVKRQACRWGAFGIVEGTINLIQSLVALDVDYDYATLLSGSDYPIKSNLEIATFLDRNRGKEFIESFLLTDPNRWSNHGGYYKTPQKVLCRHIRFRSRVMRIPGMRHMPDGLSPYGGAQWWTLSRQSMSYIADFIERAPNIIAFFRKSFIPDESFIQTVMSNSHLAERITGDDLRFAIWDRPLPPYPATLAVEDVDMLRASDKHFARKFDPHVDSAILEVLDAWRLQDRPFSRPEPYRDPFRGVGTHVPPIRANVRARM